MSRLHLFRFDAAGVRALALAAVLWPIAAALADEAAAPQPGDQAANAAMEYDDCMALARTTPAQALDQAAAWSKKGGGTPAGHCAAVALIGLGRYKEAAGAMEKLAVDEMKARKDLAADLYGQAAQAWVLANDSAHAVKDQSAAIGLAPDDPELLIDRGVTLASMAKYWEAIDDFSKAHDLGPKRADILTYRATAYRMLKSYDLARDDIEKAIKLRPGSAEAFLERGNIRMMSEDVEGAKDDWNHAISLGPGTPTAKTAAANLQQLETPAPAPAATGSPAPTEPAAPAAPPPASKPIDQGLPVPTP
jgi:tetratricopeptide (TPR) repeat protein